MSTSTTVTGYYRWTDIWYFWDKALPNPADGIPLKAILAHDALVHPDHPLHVQGVDGGQLYMGTFENGEARLLFSFAQVDYIRYWLHAMGLTKETIPLPYSDCLLTPAELRTVSPVVFPDGGSLRGANKMVEKNNKRLKGSNPTLTHRRHIFERVRTLWTGKVGVWCAIDFESWEYDHTFLTEFGWSLVRWNDNEKVEEHGHLIVDEAKNYINHKYITDRREHYRFGKSETVKRAEFRRRICELISGLAQSGPLFLVFHDNSQDIKYLKAIQAPLENLSFILPDNQPDNGLFVVDTSDLISALLGLGSGDRKSLERTCHLLQITTDYLHNAGNDAHFTLSAMISMAEAEPVDAQRERRWPEQTKNGVTVQLKPQQEDSDWEEDEDEDIANDDRVGYNPRTGEIYRVDGVDQ